ncbi:endo-1,4-beta-xylanase [Ruminococcus sp. NK3A76]|uniref:endo-1,4-beta-xylanase n=1 Tax=Ruminococcus sp. NK3A76 TaxID=877411 RepID=UPI0004915CE6|nr:endo-1,4-beta-xylanase [Ruminococcus sp. NK3A76]
MNDSLSLAAAYNDYFKIGAAVSSYTAGVFKDILGQHFNSITPENELKYSETEPEEGRFTFEEADKIFDTARALGIKVRAHAPVWHTQTPDWMYLDGDKPAAPELIYERIEAHTKALCERYNNDVYAWDVVNEAACDKENELSHIYRDSRYFGLCGESFIEKAFKAMDKYSPDAQLFYNDYSECIPEKRERIVRIIRTLQDKGCRIDGMGMQQHHFAAPDYDEIKRSIEVYASLGLRLHITELDVSLMATLNMGKERLKPGDPGFSDYIKEAMRPTPERLAGINDIYLRLFEIYRSYRDVIDCVTTWGVADDFTWLDGFGLGEGIPKVKQFPLLFDTEHSPKPCVAALCEAVK